MELIDIFPIVMDKITGVISNKRLDVKINASVFIDKSLKDYPYKYILEVLETSETIKLNKVKDLMKIFRLEEEFLNKEIKDLLPYEKRLLEYLIEMSKPFKYLIIEEPFLYLDLFYKKKIIKLFRLLIKNKKGIIIVSNDSNLLLEITDNMVLINNNQVIIKETTINFFSNIKLLNKYKIDIPILSKFTYLAKKEKIRISYHKDIRDLIKDVYKHK